MVLPRSARIPPIAFLLSAVLATGGCSSPSNQQIGGAVGAVAGIAAGALLGGKGGRVAGEVVGGAVGFILGSFIGSQLDAAEKQRADQAREYALNLREPQKIEWNSPKNPKIGGSTEVVRTDVERVGGKSIWCRQVREVVYIDGKEQVAMVDYCRDPETLTWTRKS